MKDSLVIVIPAYNEEETILSVLKEWYPVIELHNGGGNSRLLVVNDGSKDQTEEILRNFSLDHPLFAYVTRKNGGHGAAVWNGYRIALDQKADYIFQTDSDGQTSAADFQKFWEQRDREGAVMGRRISRPDGRGRLLVSRVLSLMIRLIFRVTAEDANCPYRLFGRNALLKAMELVPREYDLTNVILRVACGKLGIRVQILPVHFRKRQGGVNSINAKRIIATGWRSLREFAKLERIFRRMAGGIY